MQSDSGELPRPAGPPPPLSLQCPRCNSTDTKFCYYNNYNLSQPRHHCRSCRRYWTHGGALRNIPARLPTPKRSRSRSCSRSCSRSSSSSSSSSSPVAPPPQPSPSGASFAGLLTNSQGSDFPALEFDFGSDLEVARSFGTWQFVIGEEVELAEGAAFTWPDLTVSAPGDRFDPIRSKEMGGGLVPFKPINLHKLVESKVESLPPHSDIFLAPKRLAMGEIDPAFIQSAEHRPNLESTDPGDLPVIDLSALNCGAVDLLVAEIGKACEEWGFFQVINHGTPLNLVRRMEAAMKEFFDRSADEKLKVKRDEKNAMGYHDAEHTKNVRDWKEVLDIAIEDPLVISASPDPQDQELTNYYNQWPDNPPDFRKIWKEYAGEVEKLAFTLLKLISLSLGLAGDRLNEFFKGQTSFIRLNRYPPCPSPELALGVGRHKDAGALTVLFQDGVGGLEVRRKDGEWVGVKPIPNAFIINIGDIIQVWSNDKYESVEHRVVANRGKDRFSIPLFVLPAHHVNVKPLEELTDERNPPKFTGYNWGKFLATRNRSDFKKQAVENIQIHHFRVSEPLSKA